MFWKKKKVVEEVKVEQAVWLRLLLSDLNLLDTEGLLAIMEIVSEKQEQELAKELLSYLQPKLLENVRLGSDYVNLPNMEVSEIVKLFPSFSVQTFWEISKKLSKFNYSLNLYDRTDGESFNRGVNKYQISLGIVLKSKKENK